MTVSEVHLAIEELLDNEREVIMGGRLEDLARLVEEKETLLRSVEGIALPNPQTLKRLKEKADRNQVLLGSVVKGVRSVSARLQMLRNPQTSLKTYSASGSRHALGSAESTTMERRA